MKKILFTLLLATQCIFANNLTISNIVKNGDNQLSFDVSWDNSWWVSTYRDASWIFVKYKNSSGQWQHLDLTSATASGFTIYTYPDNKGVMLSRATSGMGTVTGTVTVNFNGGVLGLFPDFKVFGIEMVYVNQGAFYLGDGVSANRFYQGNDNTLPYYVQNSGVMTYGTTSSDINGGGGFNADVPAAFPNGYDAFYMMKYEITQEQYVEFLNTLTATQQQTRTESDLSAITASNRFVMSNKSLVFRRNAIACDANATNMMPITFYCDANNNGVPNENNDGQNVAANYLSANDCLAYLDWAALRPITDMEYEKAARGANVMPIAGDLANGMALAVPLGAITNGYLANETVANQGANGLINYNNIIGGPIRVGSLASATSTRLQSGAGFYGAMELTGNLNELTVSTNNSNLAYNGNYGDGNINSIGENDAWIFNNLNKKGGYFLNSITSLSENSFLVAVLDTRYYSLSPRGAR